MGRHCVHGSEVAASRARDVETAMSDDPDPRSVVDADTRRRDVCVRRPIQNRHCVACWPGPRARREEKVEFVPSYKVRLIRSTSELTSSARFERKR